MKTETVVILGGGVAGLSAAQELIERGFQVEVYEARATLGGKAQSQYVAGTGRGGRRDLPGEHGFRFFPSFYRHVIDTMARIPCGGGTVKDNLRASTEAGFGLTDGGPVARFLRRLPSSPWEFAEAFTVGVQRLGIGPADSLRFTERVLRYYTSCGRRRLSQYEGVSWWNFIGGDRCSPAFQRQLAAVPRTMVAMDARRGSARTIGDISMQLLVDCCADGRQIDRVLCGPTSEKWIEPWRQHLESLGVRFHLSCPVRALHTARGAVSAVELAAGRQVIADHYVLAVPIEVLRPLISADLAASDAALGRLRRMPDTRFSQMTSWMNGLQLYLRRDVPLVRGHMIYPDAPWALTSISQPQFWREDGPLEARYGDGSVRGLISVDISDWSAPGTYVRKPARECTPEEVASEVWQQLKAALNTRREVLLREEDLVTWHLDDELEAGPGGFRNHAPLLVHPPGSWRYRPEAATALPNLTLAADYVRTHTDIASMEGANEAARRAVNAILLRSGRSAAPCAVWPLTEPAVFRRARQLDEQLLDLPWAAGRHAFDLLPGTGLTLTQLTGALRGLLADRPAAEAAQRLAA